MKILLVEDNQELSSWLSRLLGQSGYVVESAFTGEEAEHFLLTQQYDAILLDLMLPGMKGQTVLKHLRDIHDDVPVLIISARDALEQRLRGLDGGADDYLLKPFEMAELLARMRAVLRRKGGNAAPLLGNGVVALDPATRQASVAGVAPQQLSSREFALLQALLMRPGAILSRSELEDRIYGWGEEVQSNAVEFLIHALRRKLGSEVIKNVRGVGWMVSKGA